MSAADLKKQTKNSWYGMQYRCDSENCPDYANYGGRGIRVCERWRSFDNFVSDMGIKPHPGLTLERKDVNGNYEPGNCVWAPKLRQANNRRSNRMVEWDGAVVSLSDLCRLKKVSYGMVVKRLDSGWSIQDALGVDPIALPWDKPVMDSSIGERPATDIELAGYMPSIRSDYFAIIHPDGTIIYHMGEDGWLRA